VVGIYSSTDAGLSSFSNQGELEQTSVTAASALSDLERIVMATGTFAPAGGVDCNNDGAIDIPAGSPIICSISSTGEGIGEAIVAVVGAATKPNAIYLPIIQKSGSSTPPPGNHAPYVPSNLLPAHNAMNVPAITELTWTGGDPDAGDVVSYDVYLEVNNSNPTRLICNDAFATNCNPPGSLLYNADYYWKVVATDKRGANTSSSIVHFKTGDIPNYPPDIPDNPIPTDGAPDQSVNISLNWTGGDPNPADTVMYDVYLDANDSNPTTLVCSNLSTTTCNLSENLLYDTDYFWKVVATDSHSASSSNIVWYFKTGNTSCDTPGTLNLVSPSDGTVAYDNKPTFTWNVASASSEYQLQVDDNIDFSSPEIDATVATLDYKPNSALHAVTYYWRVRGHNTSSGCNLFGPWSSTRSFSIDSSAIWSSPINLSNSLGTADDPDVAIGPDNSIHMVWNDNSSGSYDILYASKTSDGEWSIPVNVSNQSGDARHPAISVDSSGTVHVSWGNGFIYFAQKTSSGSWTTPETAGVGFKPRIAVGNDDTIHLAWVGSSFGNFEIYYAVKFSDGSWSPPVNLSNTGASSFDPDIDLDSQNRPHVVWDDTEPGSAEIFYVTKFGDGSWSTIENISNDGNGSRFARIAIDSTDGIHVCWIITFGPRCNYKPTSGSWSGIDHTLNSHFSHRVVPAVGADDLLRVAWTSGYDIFYSKQVGGEWLTPLNVSENGIPTIGVILGLDSKAGIDALVWADESGGSGDVYYSEATGDEIWSANAEIAGFDAVPDLLPIPTPTPAPNPR
jgi:hypothetical protein